MSVPAALGIYPTVANTVHRLMNSSFGAILPSNLQKAVLEGIFSIGRSQLSEFVLNESNPIGLLRLSRLRAIFAEGKSLQLQFPAEDLGFRYLEGALVAGSDSLKTVTEKFDFSKIKGPREYIPSAKPGSRLPHMNLRMLNGSTEDVSLYNLFATHYNQSRTTNISDQKIIIQYLNDFDQKMKEACEVHYLFYDSYCIPVPPSMELALSLEKLTNEKLIHLHSAATRSNDPQLADFVETEYLAEQVQHFTYKIVYCMQVLLKRRKS